MAFSKPPRTLDALLPSVIKKMGIQRKLDEAQAVEAWAIIAGPRINGVTEKAWVRGRTLHVKVTSSTWRHALHQQRRLWVDRLNDQLRDSRRALAPAEVEDIRFC